MKIIINNNQENILKHQVIKEMYGGLSDKVGVVKDYLDKNFARATSTVMDKNGRPQISGVVVWLDDYKQAVKTLTDVQLFYIIQDEFKNIISDKEARDNFLKQIIKDWYNKKISKNNTFFDHLIVF